MSDEIKTGKSPMDMMMDRVDWKQVSYPEPIEELHATHTGELKIGEFVFRCYQLSDGKRVVDSDDVHAFFSLMDGE